MVDQINLEYKRAEWSCMWLMWSHHGVFKSESFQRVLPYCLGLHFYDRDETFETLIPFFPQNCFDFPTDVDTSESAKDLMKRLICSAEV